MPELAEWETFYVIVGAAAGALIGLQFVVMTLIAERPPVRAAEAGAAFTTPTIVHFSAALLLSSLLTAPWKGMTIVASLWGLTGFSGAAYAAIVARRAWNQTVYKPDVEDWLFYVLLPLVTYVVLALSAFVIDFDTREALFVVGGCTLVLLFAGIHNAWDSVAYLVFVSRRNPDPAPQQDISPDNEKR